MKKTLLFGFVSILSFSFFTTFAQTGLSAGVTTLSGLVTLITTSLVKSLGVLAMACAVVAFFWGLIEYIWGSREGNPDKIKKGNQFIIWSLLALFIMFSVYGIIKFGQDIFFKGMDIKTIEIPEINFKSSGTSGSKDASSASCPLGNCPGGSVCKAWEPCTTSAGKAGVCNGSGTACTENSGGLKNECQDSNGLSGVYSSDGTTCIVNNQD